MKKLFLLLCGVFCYCPLSAITAGYVFKKEITIMPSEVRGTADLVDFPVLLKFVDPDLRFVSNGGKVQSEFGYDIVFTQLNCLLDLSHQMEAFDPMTGAVSVWVRLPFLYVGQPTVFSMYYGNNTISSNTSSVATWNSTYESVLHLYDDPSGVAPQMQDASGGIRHAQAFGMGAANLVSGVSGKALTFDEVNDHLVIPDFDYAGSNSFSISLWFRLPDNSGSSYQYLLSHGAYGTFNSMNFYIGEAALSITADQHMLKTIFQDANDATSTSGLDAGNSYTDGNWHYYVFTVNELGNPTVYIDGVKRANISFNGGQSYDPVTDIFIGARSDLNSTRFWGGEIDEVRLLNDTISAGWIETEYNNMRNPSSFVTLGAEENASVSCAPLPIDVMNLNAWKSTGERKVELHVDFSDPLKYVTFEIQKSLDLISWQRLCGFFPNETAGLFYDENPLMGKNYYRLVAFSPNGDQVSAVCLVDFNAVEIMEVYPNPIDTWTTLKVRSATTDNLVLVVRDPEGRVLILQKEEVSSGVHEIILPLEQLASGVYFITVISASEVSGQFKIVKT